MTNQKDLIVNSTSFEIREFCSCADILKQCDCESQNERISPLHNMECGKQTECLMCAKNVSMNECPHDIEAPSPEAQVCVASAECLASLEPECSTENAKLHTDDATEQMRYFPLPDTFLLRNAVTSCSEVTAAQTSADVLNPTSQPQSLQHDVNPLTSPSLTSCQLSSSPPSEATSPNPSVHSSSLSFDSDYFEENTDIVYQTTFQDETESNTNTDMDESIRVFQSKLNSKDSLYPENDNCHNDITVIMS